jgi:DNA-directed RNA polymerase subunit F
MAKEITKEEVLKERAIAKLVQVVGLTEEEIRAIGIGE